MPGSSVLIGVDVGCTSISGGLVAGDGAVLTTRQAPTNLGSGTGEATVLDIVTDLCVEAERRRLRVEAVGIGLPGLVDTDAGLLKASAGSHVADLHDVPFAERIAARTGLATFLDNDVNALALGEWWFGPGRGSVSCVVLAIGTGIGGGIILDGRLVRGKRGYAGEFGHVSIEIDGPPCNCGGRGCLFLYAGGQTIAAEARRRIATEPSSMLERAGGDPRAIQAETVFEAARDGDRVARTLVDRACRAVGAGIALVVNTLDPEVVVVTGGVAKSLVHLQEQIVAGAREFALAHALAGTRIHVVPGAKSHTVRGGAALVLYERARLAGSRSAPGRVAEPTIT